MLTVLQEQLGETHGLAISASEAVDKVESRLLEHRLRFRLDELRLDASETRARCLDVERRFGEELAAEILAHANTIGEKAADLAGSWFKAGTGPLAAWGFLAMGEAGEVVAWSALRSLAQRDGDARVTELAEWGLGVQERHLAVALEGAAELAERFEPAAPRWG
jgi:hypothetical protein